MNREELMETYRNLKSLAPYPNPENWDQLLLQVASLLEAPGDLNDRLRQLENSKSASTGSSTALSAMPYEVLWKPLI